VIASGQKQAHNGAYRICVSPLRQRARRSEEVQRSRQFVAGRTLEVIAITAVGPHYERFPDELKRNLFALIPPRAHSCCWENKTVAWEIGLRLLDDYRHFGAQI